LQGNGSSPPGLGRSHGCLDRVARPRTNDSEDRTEATFGRDIRDDVVARDRDVDRLSPA
jgi:hypothetical protein